MTFHTNDNNPIITLSNYEEYLLLYVDNELTGPERGMVEAFLQFHPELQAELDLLMGTKLQPEEPQFMDKESLFAQSMYDQMVDENLLLYVDGELTGKEKEIAAKLQKDQTYQEQYQWLLRTKSDPSEILPCPNKEALYRRTVRRIGFPFLLRIAAAVLLIASMGILYVQQDDAAPKAVASITQKPIAQKSVTGQKTAAEPNDATARVTAKKNNEQDVQKAAAKPAPVTLIAAAPARNTKKQQAATSPKSPILAKAMHVVKNEAAIAYEPAPARHKNMAALQNIEPAKKELEPGVTYEAPQPYNTSEATAKAAFAVDKEEDGRNKGNLKSLLRKATRMVERRTGINATNEDEELLIGVVALKLK